MESIAVLTENQLRNMLTDAVHMGVRLALQSQKKSPEIMDETQASEYLGIPRNTLRLWRSQKKGPRYSKAGRLVRYSRKELTAWLESGNILTIDCPEAHLGKSH